MQYVQGVFHTIIRVGAQTTPVDNDLGATRIANHPKCFTLKRTTNKNNDNEYNDNTTTGKLVFFSIAKCWVFNSLHRF